MRVLGMAVVALIGAVVVGCGSTAGGIGDAGFARDGGTPSDGGAPQDGGPARDGGTTQDGGPAQDGGPRDAGTPSDGGTTTGDGGLGCLTTGCVDLSGGYQACANCGLLGRFGPFDVDIAQTNGCQFRACVTIDGGANCTDGCVDENGNFAFTVNALGFNVACMGLYDSTTRSATLTCPLGALGSCSGTMRENLSTCN